MKAKYRNGGPTLAAIEDFKAKRSPRVLVHILLGRLRETRNASFADTELLIDLEIDALDLVRMAMKLEEIEPASGPFPLDALAHVVTVGDLAELVDRWWRGEARGSTTRRTTFL
jgi:acyl carrier protein